MLNVVLRQKGLKFVGVLTPIDENTWMVEQDMADAIHRVLQGAKARRQVLFAKDRLQRYFKNILDEAAKVTGFPLLKKGQELVEI